MNFKPDGAGGFDQMFKTRLTVPRNIIKYTKSNKSLIVAKARQKLSRKLLFVRWNSKLKTGNYLWWFSIKYIRFNSSFLEAVVLSNLKLSSYQRKNSLALRVSDIGIFSLRTVGKRTWNCPLTIPMKILIAMEMKMMYRRNLNTRFSGCFPRTNQCIISSVYEVLNIQLHNKLKFGTMGFVTWKKKL